MVCAWTLKPYIHFWESYFKVRKEVVLELSVALSWQRLHVELANNNLLTYFTFKLFAWQHFEYLIV